MAMDQQPYQTMHYSITKY